MREPPSSTTTALASRRAFAPLVAALLVACAIETSSGEGGMGLPQQLPGESYPGPRAQLAGNLHLARDGCAYLHGDGRWLVIWPAGSALSSPVRLPDGTELRDGDALTGTGVLVPQDALPGGPDGYWAHVTGFCDDGADDVVVFDEVSAGR